MTTSEEFRIRLCDVTSGEAVLLSVPDKLNVDRIIFSSDCKKVISEGKFGEDIVIWDITRVIDAFNHNKAARIFEIQGIDVKKLLTDVCGQVCTLSIYSVNFNRKQIAIARIDSSVQIWEWIDEDLKNWKLIWSSDFGQPNRQLFLHGCNVSDAIGLSDENRELFCLRDGVSYM